MNSKKKKLDNTGNNKPQRDKRGRLLPGNTANPNGKPPGALSITAIIKQKLQEEGLTKAGDKKRFIDAFIESILDNAISKQDHHSQKMIWNYIDGMPKGSLDLTTKGQKINSFDPAQVKKIAREVLEDKEDE